MDVLRLTVDGKSQVWIDGQERVRFVPGVRQQFGVKKNRELLLTGSDDGRLQLSLFQRGVEVWVHHLGVGDYMVTAAGVEYIPNKAELAATAAMQRRRLAQEREATAQKSRWCMLGIEVRRWLQSSYPSACIAVGAGMQPGPQYFSGVAEEWRRHEKTVRLEIESKDDGCLVTASGGTGSWMILLVNGLVHVVFWDIANDLLHRALGELYETNPDAFNFD